MNAGASPTGRSRAGGWPTATRWPAVDPRPAALAGGALAVLAVLVALGPRLPGPPWSGGPGAWPQTWPSWAAGVGAAGVVMAVVRLLALAADAYLLVVVALDGAGRRLGWSGLVRVSRRLCLPGLARLALPAAGVGLVASVATGPVLGVGDPAGAGPSPTVVMHLVGPTTTLTTRSTTGSTTGSSTGSSTSGTSPLPEPTDAPVMHALGPSPSPSSPGASTRPTPRSSTSRPAPRPTPSTPPWAPVQPVPAPTTAASAPAPTAEPVEPTDRPGAATWTIRPDDHLWLVSAETLARAWGRPAPDAQIDLYLRSLIETNRGRLVVPGDADLVYPGQVFALPTPPPPPS